MTQSTPNSKAQVQNEWSMGSYPAVGRPFLALAARLVEAAGVDSRDRVLGCN